ncbi:unnamed protein product [Amoebophrya sp. A25]|nr:unnamed protein product [Amoebophrya sp. A25]|eukprot:GSA25T00019968001.1
MLLTLPLFPAQVERTVIFLDGSGAPCSCLLLCAAPKKVIMIVVLFPRTSILGFWIFFRTGR